LQDKAEGVKEKSKETASNLQDKGKETVEGVKEKSKEGTSDLQVKAEGVKEKSKETANSLQDKAKETAEGVKEKSKEMASNLQDMGNDNTKDLGNAGIENSRGKNLTPKNAQGNTDVLENTDHKRDDLNANIGMNEQIGNWDTGDRKEDKRFASENPPRSSDPNLANLKGIDRYPHGPIKEITQAVQDVWKSVTQNSVKKD